jgi:hypothetical protein
LRHRTLAREKFIESISLDYLQRYLDNLKIEPRPSMWNFLTKDTLHRFLTENLNQEASDIIIEDFQRINDISGDGICKDGMNIVINMCKTKGIDYDPNEPAHQISMRLFLDNREAFDFAWSRFQLYGSPSKLSVYSIPKPNLIIKTAQIVGFQSKVQDWFASSAKGTECQVNFYQDRDEVAILIRHGSYTRPFSFWNKGSVGLSIIRPALEDILIYSRTNSQLHIKARSPKDRQEYLKLFCSDLVGDAELVEHVTSMNMFSLDPIRLRTFNYSGKAPITKVELVKLREKLSGVDDIELELKSRNVPMAFERLADKTTIKSGTITLARFRFHLRIKGEKMTSITFDIEPPSRTNLSEKRYADIIENYLRDQGVMLY